MQGLEIVRVKETLLVAVVSFDMINGIRGDLLTTVMGALAIGMLRQLMLAQPLPAWCLIQSLPFTALLCSLAPTHIGNK